MRTVKTLAIVLSMIVVCSVAGAETFRFTASADNRPYDSANLSRWEWLLDEMDRLFMDDEGVFHIMPGDIDPPETTDASLVDQFGGDVVWYPVVGNHESETPADMTWIRNAFSSLPYVVNSGPTGCETTTYSFDYGNAHFVAINEYYDGTSDTGTNGDVVDALYNWLVDDLAANTKPAVFVIGHEPAYPEYAHVGDSLDGHQENRDRFWKLLNDEKVIAYLCGHTHYYYSKTVDDSTALPGYTWTPFTWQIDCGNAGNPREPEQTFVDVTVTDTDVTFTVWQGLEGNAYTVTETWTVEIPLAHSPSPPDGATGVSPASVALSATVENPSGTEGSVNVEFFGREKPTFSIVVLPDTQKYVNVINGGNPDIFTAQTQWVVDNAATMNTVFVTHEGDITDSTDRPAGMDVPAEWERANTSMTLLDGIVPYGVLPGNHDYPTTYYNSHFPFTRYEGEPWYGGHYPSLRNDNNYQLFSAGGDDYIILHIEYDPNSSVTAWANSVLATYSDRQAIITTHSYLNTNGSLTSDGGTAIWNDIVTQNANVFFVLCGHVSGERAETVTVGDPQREVHQLLADYQSRANGGDGWLRIMTFEPDTDEVHVQTYSPWLDDYETDGDSDFVLSFDMTSVSYSSIGSEAGVASGSTASTTWPSLAMETQYEWYVTVTDIVPDPDVTVPGPDWSFTTASPKASNPNPANGATDVDVDADLSWSAGVGAVSHDVYFGSDPGNLPQVSTQQAGITYDPGTLEQGVTYYWAIDEHDSGGGVVYGDVWSFTTAVPPPLTFQQGVNGYSGMVDTMIRWADPETNFATDFQSGYDYQYNADTDSSGGPSQVLMRFDDIIGSGAGQIPTGSTIVSATLRIRSTDDGDGGNAYAMLQPWIDTAVTWNNSFGGNGIQADDNEAAAVADDGIAQNNPDTDVDLDVTATVQAWADGVANNGWAILPNGTNGCHMAAAEHPTIDYRPELIVSFIANQPPVAYDDSATTNENEAVIIDVLTNDTDAEGKPLSGGAVASVTQGANGAVVINADETVTYTPILDFDGTDTFTYQASDGITTSNTATVTVTVEGDDDPPVAVGDTYAVDEDVTLNVNVPGVLGNDSDPEGGALSAILVEYLGNGTLTLSPDGSFTYSPDADYNGSDSFTYKANDGTADSLPATVSITVNPVNDDPVTNNDTATTNEDTAVTIGVLGNDSDPDGDTLTVGTVTQGTNGSVVNNDDNVTYTPNLNFSGTDSFTYTASDGKGGTNSATVNVTVDSVNDPPTADNDSASTLRDVAVDIDVLANDSDVEGDTLSVGSITQPAHGSVLNNGANVTYTPDPAYVGDDSFTYTASDGTANSTAATVTVTVNAPGPTTLFGDGFESGNLAAGGWTSSGSVLVKERAAYEGAYGVEIGGTASITKSVSTVGFTDIRIKYARKTKGLRSGESLTVEWSADGTSWNLIESTQDTAWAQQDIALAAEADGSTAFSLRFITNASRTNRYAAVDSVEIIGTTAGPDLSAPVPNPMTWAIPPQATGSTSVSMTATTASDASGVEYYFDCLTAGGHDSGWQDSTTYTDTGLSAGTSYSYRVQARDKSPNQNATDFSGTASATPIDVAPSVTITSPADGATVSGSITVSADASDDDAVSHVEFFVDGGSIGIDTDGANGWSADWDTTGAADGPHTISAVATDTALQTGSDSIGVTVALKVRGKTSRQWLALP